MRESGGFGDLGVAEALLDVVFDDLVEFGGDVLAAQGQRLLAVDEDGQPQVTLAQRAVPLLAMLKAAIKTQHPIYWD